MLGTLSVLDSLSLSLARSLLPFNIHFSLYICVYFIQPTPAF